VPSPSIGRVEPLVVGSNCDLIDRSPTQDRFGESRWPQWPYRVPQDARGWLITVASRRLTGLPRSEQARRRREDTVARWTLPDGVTEPATYQQAVESDDTLVLLFLCCHPAPAPASQIALTLELWADVASAAAAAHLPERAAPHCPIVSFPCTPRPVYMTATDDLRGVFVRAHHHEEMSGTRPPGRAARCSPVPAAGGLPALQRMAGNAAVTRWVRERRATPAPPTAAVQRAPQDWKNTPTKKALANKKALAPNDPFVHTLHHIVPKSTLAAFAGHLTPGQRKLVVQLVGPHAKKAFTTPNDSLAAVTKALQNLPANVVLGPDPANREDDPGAQPDYNYADDGSITPRSEHLEKAYEFMNRKLNGGTPVTITNAELTSEFVQPLIDASKAHNNFAAGGVGLDRNRAAWSGDPAQGQARRPAPLEPLL
jgi:hypothetical protein